MPYTTYWFVPYNFNIGQTESNARYFMSFVHKIAPPEGEYVKIFDITIEAVIR